MHISIEAVDEETCMCDLGTKQAHRFDMKSFGFDMLTCIAQHVIFAYVSSPFSDMSQTYETPFSDM